MTTPLPCPRCGRRPRLRVGFVRAGEMTSRSCNVFKLECRRWFGLRLCFGPQRENWLEKDWGGELGERVAVERWNAAVVAHIAASRAAGRPRR